MYYKLLFTVVLGTFCEFLKSNKCMICCSNNTSGNVRDGMHGRQVTRTDSQPTCFLSDLISVLLLNYSGLIRFRRIKPFLPTDARIKFCNAFILPHFDYCSKVWSSANLDLLFKLQKRTA